jgi:hypothetical protein
MKRKVVVEASENVIVLAKLGSRRLYQVILNLPDAPILVINEPTEL